MSEPQPFHTGLFKPTRGSWCTFTCVCMQYSTVFALGIGVTG